MTGSIPYPKVQGFKPLAPRASRFNPVAKPAGFAMTRNLQSEQFGTMAVPGMQRRTTPQGMMDPIYAQGR